MLSKTYHDQCLGFVSCYCPHLQVVPTWIEGMVASSVWRDMVASLSESYPDCFFLKHATTVCTASILAKATYHGTAPHSSFGRPILKPKVPRFEVLAYIIFKAYRCKHTCTTHTLQEYGGCGYMACIHSQ